MGKKKKVEISKEALSPTTVGQVNKHRFGWIFLVIAFAFFIAMVYYLPDIYAEYENNGSVSMDYIIDMVKATFIKSNANVNTNINANTASKYNDINNVTTGEIGNLSYTNVVYNNNLLSFEVKNKTTNTIDFSIESYYIELYSESDTALERKILTGSIEASESKTIEFKLSSVPKYYQFYQIENEKYPSFELKKNEEGLYVMSCADEDATYEYTFVDNKLTKINDIGKYIITDEDYENKFNYYNNLKNNNSKPAVSVTINSTDDEFSYNLEIDYTKGDAEFGNKYYFSKDTSSEKIAYLMEAESIICR